MNKILYIEDDEIMAELMCIHLSNYNIEATIACNGAEGIAAYNPQQHEVVVIDWNLPDGRGSEIAQKIRVKNDKVRIIFVSAAYSDQGLVEAKNCKPLACLIKDLDVAGKIAEFFTKQTVENT